MSRVGRFLLVEPIGRGGMGEVWRAVHEPTGRTVAVKVVASAHDERDRALLRAEIRAVAALDHLHVVRVYDQGETGPEAAPLPAGSPWLAMAWAPDGTWRAGDAPDWPTLRRLLRDVLAGLGHAHARGLLHLDVKPSNLLRDGDRTLLADFGVAARLGEARTITRGTPAFMAPEQHAGRWRDLGPPTDLYALGCTVFALLSGGGPFGGDANDQRARHLAATPAWPEPTPTTPDGLVPWLATLLHKAPEARFASAAEARRALDEVAAPAQAGPIRWGRAGADQETVTTSRAGEDVEAAPLPAPAARSIPLPGPVPEAPPRPPPEVSVGLGLFGFRDPGLIGRQAERQVLWTALGEVTAARRARFVAVRGASGAGKSRLARWLAETAAERGCARVITATHGPREQAGDGILAALARALGVIGLDRADTAERLVRRMGPAGRTVAAIVSAAMASPDEVALAVRLAATADPRPLLVVLDDAQWGLPALDAGLRLVNRGEGAPVLVVATVRDEELANRSAEAALLDELLATAGALPLPVERLGEPEVEAMLRDLLHLDPDLSDRLVARAGGNPLFSIQLVADWVRHGWLVSGPAGLSLAEAAPALPDDLRVAWSERLDRVLADLGHGGREAVVRAAILGREVDDAEWTAVAPGAPHDAVREGLIAARFAEPRPGGWRFVHDAVPEAIRASARDQHTTIRLHDCIDALRARGAPAHRLAPLLLEAEEWDAAADALIAAALRGLAGASLRAVPPLLADAERSLDALGEATGPRRARIAVIRAHTETLRGRPADGAARALQVLAADPPPDVRGYALRILATGALSQGRREEALAGYREARAAYALGADAFRVALCDLDAGGVLLGLRRLDEAEAVLRPTLDAFDPTTHPTLYASTWVAWSRLHLFRGDGDAAAGITASAVEALGGRPSAVLSIALDDVGLHALVKGRLDEAEEALRASLRMMLDLGFHASASPRMKLSWLALLRQRHDEARRELEESERAVATLRSAPFEASALALRIAVEAEARDDEAVSRALPRLEALRGEIEGTDELTGGLLRRAASTCGGPVAARVRALAESWAPGVS